MKCIWEIIWTVEKALGQNFNEKNTLFSKLLMREESLFFMYLDLIMVTKKKGNVWLIVLIQTKN